MLARLGVGGEWWSGRLKGWRGCYLLVFCVDNRRERFTTIVIVRPDKKVQYYSVFS